MADAADVYGGQDVGVVPIEPTDDGIGLVLLAPPSSRDRRYPVGCYRMREALHASSLTGEARVLVVPWWVDYRASPLWPGDLPAGAESLVGRLVPLERLSFGSVVADVPVSRQYVALVCRVWGVDVVWAPVSRGGARYAAAWKFRTGVAGALPVAALAPLGERAGRVDPLAGERAEA